MGNGIRSETIGVQHGKRKNFLILAIILSFVGILFGMFYNFYSSNAESFKEKKKQETKKEATTQNSILDKGEYNEAWAISVENSIDNLNEQVSKGIDANEKSFREELGKNNDAISAAVEDMKAFVEINQKSSDDKISRLSDAISALTKTTDEKISRVSSDFKRSSSVNSGKNSDGNSGLPPLQNTKTKEYIDNNGNSVLLPSDPASLPGLDDQPSQTQFQGRKNMDPSSIAQKQFVAQKKVFIGELTNDNIKKAYEDRNTSKPVKTKEAVSYEIATGFMDALMITGAYAPLFGEATDEASIPVLLQAKGDLLIANGHTESVEDCFLLGGAIGNPSSNTVDIRLSKLECVLADGKSKIRGDVKGWVVGEDGKPGVKGELIHKSGEYISRFIVAGFLESFSTALVNAAQPSGTGVGTTTSILSGGASTGAATGVQNAFTKLSDFYIKLAEKTLPMIEAKGGRKVSILLNGGNVYKVEKFNKLNVGSILNDYIATSHKKGKKK